MKMINGNHWMQVLEVNKRNYWKRLSRHLDPPRADAAPAGLMPIEEKYGITP